MNKKILSVSILAAVFVTMVLFYLSKSQKESQLEKRNLKVESTLITTPAIETTDNLNDSLKELDSMSPDVVGKDLLQNDVDSKSL